MSGHRRHHENMCAQENMRDVLKGRFYCMCYDYDYCDQALGAKRVTIIKRMLYYKVSMTQ